MTHRSAGAPGSVGANGQGTWPAFDWHARAVIVTGGAGFLGRHVVAALQSTVAWYLDTLAGSTGQQAAVWSGLAERR